MDIFDYKNVIDILIGMSDKQKQTLAEKLVDRFPTVAEDMATFFNQYIQDKDEMDQRPIFTEGGCTFAYIKV